MSRGHTFAEWADLLRALRRSAFRLELRTVRDLAAGDVVVWVPANVLDRLQVA